MPAMVTRVARVRRRVEVEQGVAELRLAFVEIGQGLRRGGDLEHRAGQEGDVGDELAALVVVEVGERAGEGGGDGVDRSESR